VWSALSCVYVLWGSTYLAIRVMVEDVPPLLGAGEPADLHLRESPHRRGPAGRAAIDEGCVTQRTTIGSVS
jgi:hypothetical protein